MPTPQKTRGIGIRVTTTQYALLNTPKYKNKSSALTRVLLSLFFNGRIPEAASLLELEISRAKEAISEQQYGKEKR
jgi:hypothetical protein